MAPLKRSSQPPYIVRSDPHRQYDCCPALVHYEGPPEARLAPILFQSICDDTLGVSAYTLSTLRNPDDEMRPALNYKDGHHLVFHLDVRHDIPRSRLIVLIFIWLGQWPGYAPITTQLSCQQSTTRAWLAQNIFIRIRSHWFKKVCDDFSFGSELSNKL